MPHKIGYPEAADAVDEKIRSEVANYGWIEKNCPEVPIPNLISLGFPAANRLIGVEHVVFARSLLITLSLHISDTSHGIVA